MIHSELQQAFHSRMSARRSFQPLTRVVASGSTSDRQLGEQLIAEGKVGCIILAGGQGSRLGGGPSKGMVPVSLIKNKSLFQLFFEKAAAAARKAGRSLPLAIMTSPLNHSETRAYLEKHRWFGAPPETVELFCQEMQPFLDDSGRPLIDSAGQLVQGPDGNGHFFRLFFQSSLGEKWKREGIEILSVILIDNPLADPFDAEQCGLLARTSADAVIKAVSKSHPQEQVGAIALQADKACVVEYFELTDEEKESRDSEGKLKYGLANTGILTFSLQFLEQAAADPAVQLPWHFAQKLHQGLKVWKCERFIFDLLAYASKTEVLVCPREKCFSPLKALTGEACLETVKNALHAADKAAYFELTGIAPPDKPFELDPLFYYPTAQLREQWKGRNFPEGDYISAEI